MLPCSPLSPTPMRLVLSCTELSTMKDLGAAQYRTPQGGYRQSWLPKLSVLPPAGELRFIPWPTPPWPTAMAHARPTVVQPPSHEDPPDFQRIPPTPWTC